MKKTDEQGIRIADVFCILNMGDFVFSLDEEKNCAVQNQSGGNDHGQKGNSADFRMVQKAVDGVVKQKRDRSSWDTGENDLQPAGKGVSLKTDYLSFPTKEDHLIPKKKGNGKDRAQLNDHEKYLFEFFALIERQESVQKQQMPCTADGKPFGDSF